MGDTAQYYELCAIVLPLPCYSACVYIPFMFQQCDKRYILTFFRLLAVDFMVVDFITT